jgi:L-amino acid N-acyltransferase YncA
MAAGWPARRPRRSHTPYHRQVGEDFTVRAAVSADLEAVAAICAHYVRTTVTTFEEVPPTVADGRLRRVGRKQGRWIDTLLMQRDLERER